MHTEDAIDCAVADRIPDGLIWCLGQSTGAVTDDIGHVLHGWTP